MTSMNEKQKLLTIAGVSLVLTLGAGGGVYWAKGLVEAEGEAIAQKQAQIDAAEKKIAKIKGVEEEVIILRENLGEYVKILPNDTEVEEFVQAVHNFTSQTAVIIDSAKPGRTRGKGAGGFSQVTYEYALQATLWQALELMNLIESYDRFIKVTKFDLQSRDSGNSSDADKVNGDVRHTINMAFETYVYQGAKDGQSRGDLLIPNYAFKRDALKEDIFRRRQAIQIEEYEFRGSLGRRDIFADPRMSSYDVTNTPVEDQIALIERYDDEVKQLTKVFDRMTAADTMMMEEYRLRQMLLEGISRVEAEIKDINDRGAISFRPYQVRWNNDVELPFGELRNQLTKVIDEGKSEQDNFLKMADLVQLHETMVRFVRTGNLDEAIRRYEEVDDHLGVPSDDPRFQKVLDISTLHKKAIVAKEFQRLRLDIQGVVVRDDGRSGVLINDLALEEGDYVGPDCFVKKVMSEQVAFIYKGLTLIKTF